MLKVKVTFFGKSVETATCNSVMPLILTDVMVKADFSSSVKIISDVLFIGKQEKSSGSTVSLSKLEMKLFYKYIYAVCTATTVRV